MIHAIARYCFRRTWVVIPLWIGAFIILMALSSALGSSWLDQGTLKNAESTKALELIQKELPSQESSALGVSGRIVFYAKDGIAQHQQNIEKYLNQLIEDKRATKVVSIESPFEDNYASQVSQNGKVAYATVNFDPDAKLNGLGQPVIERSKEIRNELTVEFSGYVFNEFEMPASEAIGIIAALIILLVAFGSLVAAGLPIFSALIGVSIGASLVTLWSHIVGVPDFSTNIAAMIALGVGIDYALFIVTRYREALKRGHDRESAVIEAMTTAGAAVVFAGLTVVISLLGMLVINIDFISGLSIAASTSVFVMVLASLTLVPALLGSWVGKYLDKIPPRTVGIYSLCLAPAAILFILDLLGISIASWLYIAALILAPIIVASIITNRNKLFSSHTQQVPDKPIFWVRWSEQIQKHPWLSAIAGVAILVILAIPFFQLRVGVTDEGNGKEKLTTKRAYDLLSDGFGPGFNGSILAVVDLENSQDSTALIKIVKSLEETKGVVEVSPSSEMLESPSSKSVAEPSVTSNATSDDEKQSVDEITSELKDDPTSVSSEKPPSVVPLQVFVSTSPQDEQTAKLIHKLRNEIIPELTRGTGANVYIGGVTAFNIDFADVMAEKVPIFIAAVLILSFLLLMCVFRSILVPLKAVIMNILSITAAYGLVVAIFQWGWMRGFFGIGEAGPIEPWAPMMMFAIVFGLSMDYEVFLLSKIREEYDETKDNSAAVTHGLASTARVITAAALIMVFVFGSFVLADNRALKLMGLGLSVAVLLDATVVRMLLVPATMELLGDKNWWFPRWLDKIIPTIHVEKIPASKTSAAAEPERTEA